MTISTLAAVLCLLAATSTCLPYSTTDQRALYSYPSQAFLMVGNLLHQQYNQPGQQVSLKYADESTNLDMVISQFKPFRSLSEKTADVTAADGTITYRIPAAFTFDLDLSYVLTFAFVPLSGVCTYRLTATDVTYKLVVSERSISPSFQGTWKLEIFNVTNSLALFLGVRKIMSSAISAVGGHFDEAINEILSQDVRRYYEDYFGTTNSYVYFQHLRNASIVIANQFSSFSLETYMNSPALRASYDQRFDPLPSVPSDPEQVAAASQASAADEEGFLRCVQISMESVASILGWELYLTHETILTEDMVPEGSFFHADLQSLGRILPDLPMQYGKRNVTLSFTGQPENLVYNFEDAQTIQVAGLRLNLSVSLDGTSLLRVAFNLTASFRPYFTASSDDTRRVFMNLQAVSVHAEQISADKTLNNENALFNREAINEYLRDMADNYFLRFFGSQVLGSGVLLSFGLPVAREKIRYGTETGKEIKVYLFAAAGAE